MRKPSQKITHSKSHGGSEKQGAPSTRPWNSLTVSLPYHLRRSWKIEYGASQLVTWFSCRPPIPEGTSRHHVSYFVEPRLQKMLACPFKFCWGGPPSHLIFTLPLSNLNLFKLIARFYNIICCKRIEVYVDSTNWVVHYKIRRMGWPAICIIKESSQ